MMHNYIITAHSVLTNSSFEYKIQASDSREAYYNWIESKFHKGWIIDSIIKEKEN